MFRKKSRSSVKSPSGASKITAKSTTTSARSSGSGSRLVRSGGSSSRLAGGSYSANSATSSRSATSATPPKLVRRRENRASTFKTGRMIGERREKLETRNEREAAHKKTKKRRFFRIFGTVLIFVLLAGILAGLVFYFLSLNDSKTLELESETAEISPTIEVVDVDGVGNLTSRMLTYIATAEQDFKDFGYVPLKAVVPSGAIREVDFYLDGYSGYVKLIIDRDSAVSVEDADRMIRYLASIGVADFEYIDVRIEGKAFWK